MGAQRAADQQLLRLAAEAGADERVTESLSRFTAVQSCHRGAIQLLRYAFPFACFTPEEAWQNLRPHFIALLNAIQARHNYFATSLIFNVDMVNFDQHGVIESNEVIPFRSSRYTIMPVRSVEPIADSMFAQLNSHVDAFIARGSGWCVNDVLFADCEVTEKRPLVGSCDSVHIAVMARVSSAAGRDHASRLSFDPEVFTSAAQSGSVEQDCFYLAIAAYFLPHEQDVTTLRRFAKITLVWAAETPVSVERIRKVENANRHLDLNINVVCRPDDSSKVFPVYVSAYPRAARLIVLLLGPHFSPGMCTGHYALIRNPYQALAPRSRTAAGHMRTRRNFLCFNCFNWQDCEESHLRHVEWCHSHESQIVRMPRPKEKITYDRERGRRRSRTTAFVVFFDFETRHVKPSAPCACSEESRLAARIVSGEATREEVEGECER